MNTRGKLKSSCTCPICADVILDKTATLQGHEAIFCDGDCQSWLHRGCAGLSKARLLEVSKYKNPFYCPQCQLARHSAELESLKSTIELLTAEMTTLKAKVDSLTSPCVQPMHDPIPDTPALFAEVVSHGVRPSETISKSESHPPHDTKFNVVLFGIKESDKGTPRHQRISEDFNSALSVMRPLAPSLSEHALRDCLRLGKYTVEKSRPLLVKLCRSCDVATILSNRSQLSSTPGISIKPDRSRADRQKESVLLKERRALINGGVSSRSIKIRNNCLLVDNEVVGRLDGLKFINLEPSSPSSPAVADAPGLAGSQPAPPLQHSNLCSQSTTPTSTPALNSVDSVSLSKATSASESSTNSGPEHSASRPAAPTHSSGTGVSES